ncbi:MAG: hypothetical protein LQ342_005785 [Letrouitia transgressa]|nr:MAG: hypothetical protein LQ342_005785 [Letrouitia transgressa]
MSSSTPQDYVALSSISKYLNSPVNLMGLVTDVMPATRSKGTDWMSSFRLTDSTIYDDGVKIRFFREREDQLPRIQGTGDVAILQKVRISSFCGMTIGLSNKNTNWVVFHAMGIPESLPSHSLQLGHIKGPGARSPTQQEMAYAIELYNSRDRASYTSLYTNNQPQIHNQSSPKQADSSGPPTLPAAQTVTAPVNFARRDKFTLIKDAQIDIFYDLVGQVVKIYPNNGIVELYVTDYTSNSLLYNYVWAQAEEEISREGDPYGYIPTTSRNRSWPGPFGKMTLTVTLWPPHSHFAQENVKENQFVFLRNTRVRYSKDAKMEGSMHTDQRDMGRIGVTIIKDHSDERVKNVLRRKLEYTKRFKEQTAKFIDQARGEKRKQEGAPLSKSAKRKRRKQQQQTMRQKDKNQKPQSEAEQQTPNSSPPPARPEKHDLNKNSMYSSSHIPADESSLTLAATHTVRTSKPHLPTRPLSSIISLTMHAIKTPNGTPFTLPFQNINSRTTARVVDFSPSNLADFSVPAPKPSEFDVLSDCSEPDEETLSPDPSAEITDSSGGEASNDHAPQRRKWEWRFSLTLEDACAPTPGEEPARQEVYVVNEDAEFLLRMDATNLRRKPQALAELREKLFLLWGDLEERKAAGGDGDGEGDGTKEQPLRDKESDQRQRKGPARERPRGKPFECCLKEYGVKNGEAEKEGLGWARRFRMFGTTIV